MGKSQSLVTSSPADDEFVDACAVADIPENRARIVCVSGERVAIFKYEGKLSAVSNVCQHQNGPLGEGKAAPGIGKTSRKVVIALLLLGLLVPVMLAFSQRMIGASVFEWGTHKAFSGVIQTRPYPHLLVPRPGNAGGYLLCFVRPEESFAAGANVSIGKARTSAISESQRRILKTRSTQAASR